MNSIKTKSRVVLLMFSLLFGTLGVIAPASALPTVTASNGGTYSLKNGVAITPITFTVAALANGQQCVPFRCGRTYHHTGAEPALLGL